MTVSELASNVTARGSKFFTRNNMKFSGDKISNYGLRGPIEIETYSGPATVYELYRRKPVKHGLKGSAYFDASTFEQRYLKR